MTLGDVHPFSIFCINFDHFLWFQTDSSLELGPHITVFQAPQQRPLVAQILRLCHTTFGGLHDLEQGETNPYLYTIRGAGIFI